MSYDRSGQKTLSVMVSRSLADRILDGQYDGGFLLSQADLAKEFRVSVRVVREALQALSAQGLVELQQGRLARVRRRDVGGLTTALRIAVRDFLVTPEELLEAQRPLERAIARLAAERAEAEGLQKMEAVLRQMDESARGVWSGPPDESRVTEYLKLDVEFHRLLAWESKNPVLVVIVEALADAILQSRTVSARGRILLGKSPDVTRAAHWAIYRAIAEHDAAAAERAIESHIDETRDHLRAAKRHPNKAPTDETFPRA